MAELDYGELARQEISRQWRGEIDFTWLIWVNLLLARLATYFVARAATDAPLWVWLVLLPAIICIYVWQLVGTYRHARDTLDRPEGISICAALFVAMMAVTMSTGWQLLDQHRHMFVPVKQTYVDPSIIKLPVSADGTEIFFTGPITLKMYNAFRDLQNYENLEQVTLDSDGGNIFAARGLLRLIEERSLRTHVTGNCYSACTLVFIAGQRRSAESTAQFGFHGYSYELFSSLQTVDVQQQQDRDKTLFLDRGVPESFVEQIYNTPADHLWRPGREELVAANILK